MRKLFFAVIFIVLASMSYSAFATEILLYADSAPNVYGSPNWAPWWAQTKADVAAGTFTNMRTGTYPGTNWYDPYDEIVYSTGDLGKRIHWTYWLPGQSIADLTGLFQVKWVIDWSGNDWTLSGGAWALDGPEVGWTQPASWENYSGGVIGSLGFAWWATDDDALPLGTDANPYNETNQADIDALRASVLGLQTYANGIVRYRNDANSEWQYRNVKLESPPVPEPGTLLMLGSGLICIGGYAKTRFRRKNKKS